MKVDVLSIGLISTNTYIIKDGENAILIDPDGDAAGIMKELADHRLAGILLTHGHFDHIGAAEAISKQTGVPVFVGADDRDMLTDSEKNASSLMLHMDITANCPDVRDVTGDEFTLGGFKITPYHTPGHTEGSYSYLIGESLFSGDLVFWGSYGRCDLWGGSYTAIIRSIKSLKELPENTKVYTGHGMTGFTLSRYFDSVKNNILIN